MLTTSYYKIKFYYAKQAKLNKICNVVIEKLKHQQKLAIQDETGLTKSYVGSIQLRDLLLQSNKNKSKAWKEIEKKVESNTNVRSQILEMYGEIMRTWEWIGNLD